MKSEWIPISEIMSERGETANARMIASGEIPILKKIEFSKGQIHFREKVTTATGMIAIHPGDLVFSGINALKGAISIYRGTQPIAATIHYSAYKINTGRANPEYLRSFFRSPNFKNILEKQLPTGIKNEIKASRLLKVKIPIPSLEEQNRIQAMQNSVLVSANATRVTLEQLRSAKNNFLKQISARTGAREETLGSLLAEPIRNGYSPNCPTEKTGIWTLTLGAVDFDGFRSSKVKPAPVDDPKVKRFFLADGDLLVSRSNTRERVGLSGIYRGNPERCSYPDLLMRVRVDSKKVLAPWVHLCMSSEYGRGYFERMARGTSGTMVKIDGDILRGFKLFVPPIDVQAEAIKTLAKFDDAFTKGLAIETRLEQWLEAGLT